MQSFPRLLFPHPTVACAAGAAAVAAASAASGASAGQVDQQLRASFASVRLHPVLCTASATRVPCCSCCSNGTALSPCRGTGSNNRRSRKTPVAASRYDCKHDSDCRHKSSHSFLNHSRSQGSSQSSHPSSYSESVLDTEDRRRGGSSSYNNASASDFCSIGKDATARSEEEGVSCGTPVRPSHTAVTSGSIYRCISRRGKIESSSRIGSVFNKRLGRGSGGTSTGRYATSRNSTQLYLTRGIEADLRSIHRRDRCRTVLRGSKIAACCEEEVRAPARLEHCASGGRHVAPVHSCPSADVCATAAAGAALSNAASNNGASHAGFHSPGPPRGGGLYSFFALQRWSNIYSKVESVRLGARSEVATPFPRTGVAVAAATPRAAPTAQRVIRNSMKGTAAACAATGVAALLPEAAAAPGGGASRERTRRPPAEDAAVNLATEVGLAVEGLRRLQQQQHQRQQVEMQQQQRQPQQQLEHEPKQPLDGAPGHPGASFNRNRPWRQLPLKDEDFVCLKKRWLALLERLRPLGHISTGNSVKLYDDGDTAFTAMLHEIDRAQRDVLLETYMFDASLLACRVKDALCEAAQRGCFVVLIVDWVGSINMPFAWKKELLASGVHLLIFNPRLFLPVFAGTGTWPQGATVGAHQNVFSPLFEVFRYFFASHRPDASSYAQTSSVYTTDPTSRCLSNNSSNCDTDTSESGNSIESPSGKDGDSSSATQKVPSYVIHSGVEDSASQNVPRRVSSQSQADKEGTARTAGISWDAVVAAHPGVSSLTRANGKKTKEEISAPHTAMRGRAFVEEEEGSAVTAEADLEAPRAAPCLQAAHRRSSAASGDVGKPQDTAKQNDAAAIAASGVPKRLLWVNKVGPVPFRDHRKILVVDGRSAFIGSLNVSEDGVGKKYGGRGFFYDLHARLRGPVVRRLQQLVLETIEISHAFDLAEQLRCHLSTTASLQRQALFDQALLPADKPRVHAHREQQQRWPWLLGGRWRSDVVGSRSSSAVGSHSHHFVASLREAAQDSAEADGDDAEDVLIQVLKSNVLHNERSIQAALQAAISNASKSVCLTSSYFIPPGFLRRALHAALSRGGVDVSLLLSGNSDVWGDVYATIYVVRKFLTKNSRRHSLFSAGWERGPLKENSIITDLAASFSSGFTQQRTPSVPSSGGNEYAISTQSEAVASDPSRSAAALTCHEDPVTSQARPEKQAATAADASRKASANTAAPAGTDGSEPPAPVCGVAAARTTTAADAAAAVARETESEAAAARSAESRALPGGEGREVTDENQGRAGVYFLSEHHCHAKNIVVDHLWSSLGSFNFDRFSSRRNLEVLVSFFDPQIAYKLETLHWKRITEEAEEMTVEKWNRQPFIKKLLCSCCYYLTRFAGKNFFDGLSDQRSRAILKRLLIASYLDDMPAADIFLGMAWGVH